VGIEKGQKYEPVWGTVKTRVIEVTEEDLNKKGVVKCLSKNLLTGKTRELKIKTRRLISGAYKLIPILALFFLSGCAGLKTKLSGEAPKAVCQAQPQWYINDEKGRPTKAIYVCFGDKNVVLYDVRQLSAAETEKLIKPTVEKKVVFANIKDKEKPARKMLYDNGARFEFATVPSADPCSDLTDEAYTKCRVMQRASHIPGEGLKPVGQ
jgi:hypothetical protein